MITKEVIYIFSIKDEFTDSNYTTIEKEINSLIIKGEKNFIVDCSDCIDIEARNIQNLAIISNRAKKNLANFVILSKKDSEIDRKFHLFKVDKNVPYFYSIMEAMGHIKMKESSGLKYFTMEMAFSGELDNLPLIREYAWSVLHNLPITHEEGNLIVLSIDEAVANIMKHAYKGSKERHLIVQAQYKKPNLRFVLIDNGDEFDPTEKSEEDLNIDEYIKEGHAGGLGIYIIEQVMDNFQHLYIPNMGNRLILEKKVETNENSNSR